MPWQRIAIAGVVLSSQVPSSITRPEAYLYGRSFTAGWTLFNEYCHPPQDFDTKIFHTPRLPPLTAGDRVDCLAPVRPHMHLATPAPPTQLYLTVPGCGRCGVVMATSPLQVGTG